MVDDPVVENRDSAEEIYQNRFRKRKIRASEMPLKAPCGLAKTRLV